MNEDTAARLDSSLKTLRQRSTLAVIALAAVMVARGVEVLALNWSLDLLALVPQDGHGAPPELMDRLRAADAVVNATSIAIALSFVAAAFTFSWWTHRLVLSSQQLDAKVGITPGGAIWAFVIPILGLIKPYKVFNDLHRALEPDNVALPAPRVDHDAQGDYRSTKFVEMAPAGRLPQALLGLWWGAFVVMCLASRLLTATTRDAKTISAITDMYHGNMFVSAVAVVAAGLAITVVRGFTARAGERYRRIRGSTTEELAAQGISVG